MEVRIADPKMKNERRIISIYLSVSACICTRSVGGYSPLFIEHLWKHILLIRKQMTKGGPFLFVYREVFAVALRIVGGYSLSLIEYS